MQIQAQIKLKILLDFQGQDKLFWNYQKTVTWNNFSGLYHAESVSWLDVVS